MALPQNTTTIEDFIDSGRGITLSYFNLSFADMMSNGTWVSVLNVVSDYIEELKSVCVNVELTQEQQMAYFYKPKLLCYDVYGNPELYYIILLLNEIFLISRIFSKLGLEFPVLITWESVMILPV